jgi:hypothetical protein
MEIALDLIKILLPAGAVLYAMYLTVRSFLEKDFEKRMAELKIRNAEQILPVRLQAYERVTLLLERISPSNLIMRMRNSQLNVAQFQELLISSIREEYNHNLSQQVYMSDKSWQLVRQAKEETISLINRVAQNLSPEDPSNTLAKKVIEAMVQANIDPCGRAIVYVKKEIQELF